MRILNEDEDKKIDNVSIFLTYEEGKQLLNYLQSLLDNPLHHHIHLSSKDYQKEITLSIYNDKNLTTFDSITKKLITDDE